MCKLPSVVLVNCKWSAKSPSNKHHIRKLSHWLFFLFFIDLFFHFGMIQILGKVYTMYSTTNYWYFMMQCPGVVAENQLWNVKITTRSREGKPSPKSLHYLKKCCWGRISNTNDFRTCFSTGRKEVVRNISNGEHVQPVLIVRQCSRILTKPTLWGKQMDKGIAYHWKLGPTSSHKHIFSTVCLSMVGSH